MNGSWKVIVGTVDTIYEEEDCDINDDGQDNDKCSSLPSNSTSSSPNSKSASPSHHPRPHDLNLHSRVHSWSVATGEKTDVSIYVQGTCFNLHKDPLTSRSSYFRRQLKQLSQVTLPLNITAETFTLVAEFCYGADLAITPFNLASLRTAAELLGMTAVDCRFRHNLADLTESYFDRVVAANPPLALIVLKSSIRLLPESETAAGLVTRCVESLDLDGGDGDMNGLADDIMRLRAPEFLIVAESIQCRLHRHDELYLLVDLYIRDRGGEMSEEEKTEICNCVDCDKLSPPLLVHAVQNHRLPLRFIVRAMLIEQLNTRRAIFAAKTGEKPDRTPATVNGGSVTLGSLLRRDAAAREAGQIKAEMEATSFRIGGLEKEIEGMKKRLMKSEEEKTALEKQLMMERWAKAGEEITSAVVMRDGDCRSASFHYGGGNKVERGERGSCSFAVRVEREEKKEKGKEKKKGKGMGIMEKLKSKFQGFQLIGSECRPQSRFSAGDEKCKGDGGKGEVDGQTIKVVVASSHKRTQSLA